jgi:hypothetical protein
VRLTAIAAAAGLPAATGNRAQASFEERLRVAEEAENRGELALEPIELLAVGTGIVANLTHGDWLSLEKVDTGNP